MHYKLYFYNCFQTPSMKYKLLAGDEIDAILHLVEVLALSCASM